MGMLKVPVPMTLALGVPEIVPKSAEARMATLAGPPRKFPTKEVANFVK